MIQVRLLPSRNFTAMWYNGEVLPPELPRRMTLDELLTTITRDLGDVVATALAFEAVRERIVKSEKFHEMIAKLSLTAYAQHRTHVRI